MAAIIGALRGVLSLDSAAFDSGAKRAQVSMSSMQRAMANVGADMQTIGKRMTLAIAAPLAAVASIGAVISTIREYETSMSKLGAVTRATGAELTAMRNISAQLGATTEFSAKQAADGLTFLGMAGFTASESMAAIPAVLDLATASGMGLGRAADIASNILSGFGVAADRAGAAADILAAASSRSNTTVEQLGSSMSTVAPIAAALGIDMADTAAAIGVLSDAGIQGERAGTALRGVLAALAGPTDAAQAAFSALGLSVAQLNPETNSLSSIMERLGASGLSTAQAMEIFGREAASGALVMVDGARRLGEFGAELRNVDGEAARMADTIRDNLGGDMDTLASTTQGLILALGEAGLTAALRAVVQAATAVVRVFSSGVTAISNMVGAINQYLAGANQSAAAERVREAAIDSVSIAIGDQINASNQLKASLESGVFLSLDVARAKLQEAMARREVILAMEQERMEHAISATVAGEVYQSLQSRIENVRFALNSLAGAGADLADLPLTMREQYEGLEQTLVILLGRQKEMLTLVSSGTVLREEESAALALIENNILDIEQRLASANSELGNGVSLSDRIGSMLGRAAGEAGMLATNLSAAASALSAVMSATASLNISTIGLQVQNRALEAGNSLIEARTKGLIAAKREELFANRSSMPDGMIAQADAELENYTKAVIENSAAQEANEALVKAATAAIDGSGGGGGASKAMKAAAKEAKALASEIEKLEFDADPLKKYNSELANLNELAANGLSHGAFQKAVKELGLEFAESVPYVGEIADAVGDFVARGFKDFKSLLGGFRDMIKQMIATAISNPIKLALTAGMTGGVPGAALAGGVPGAASGGGMTGILGSIAGIGKAFAGGLGLAVDGLLSGGVGGMFSAIGGQLGVATTSATAFAGALGAVAVPLLAVAAVFSFLKKKTELLDSGIQVTVDNMDVLVETFDKIKTTKFWGLSKKVSENFTAAEAELARPLVNAYLSMRESVVGMAETLNLGTSALDDFAMSIKISTKDMTQEQALQAVQEELNNLAVGMAERLIGTFTEVERAITKTVPDFGQGGISFKQVTETITETIWTMGEFAREGETALDTLTRLSSSLVAVNAMMDTLGHHMFSVGLAGADMASQLADAFGGLDAMNQATGAYYQAFYSEGERIATTTRQTTAAMERLGLIMPQTRDQYRSMIEALDLTTEAGRNSYAALVSLSAAFDAILPAIGSFTAAIAGMVGAITTDVDGMIADAVQAQRASEQAASLWYRTSTTLRAFIADLRGTAGALISGAEAQAFNEARFQSLLAGAIAGDNQAAGDLTGAARALLTTSAATAKSAVEQARMEARVLSDLQLASGVSDVEGARHDVIAGLQGDQVSLLSEVRDYLAGGGAIDPVQLDALNGQLGALGGAIKAAEMINYAFLRERLAVTVDLLATADLPADVRRLIANAQTGVNGTINFVVRSDLGPDEKWLALTGASEHIKTIKYVLDDAQWPDEVQDLALTAGGVYRQTIRYIAQNTMSADLTGLALADASTLLKSIKFTAGALPADVRQILFNQIAPLQKRINFMVGDNIPDHLQSLALDDADTFLRVINTVAGNVVTGAVRDLALADPTGFQRSLNVLAGRLPDNQVRRLALDAASRFERVIDLRAGRTLSADTVRLAIGNVGAFSRTINLLAGSNVSPELRRIALAGNSELSRVVNAALASGADQRAIQLALGNVGAYSVAVRASLTASADVQRIVFGEAGSYAAMVTAAISADMSGPARRILLERQGRYVTNIFGALSTDMPDSTRRLLLDANTQAVRGVTIAAVFASALTPEQREALRASGVTVLRTISAMVNPVGWSATALLFMDQIANGNGVVGKTVHGKVTVDNLNDTTSRLFYQGAEQVQKTILGEIKHPKSNGTAASRLFWMESETIKRAIRGSIDLASLTAPQRTLLDSINGSQNGKLTLGGSFVFDPSTAFSVWFGSTTQSNISAPITLLRANLAALTEAMRAETAARAASEKLQSQVGGANKIADMLGRDEQGRVLATEGNLMAMARAAGVSTNQSTGAIANQVSGLSATDGIDGINMVTSLKDYLWTKFKGQLIPVDGADYARIYTDAMRPGAGYEDDPAGHYRDYGRREIMLGTRAFVPQAFDWSSIGVQIPGYAAGGMHSGGWRVVGEDGPELEATGPSRIYNAQQTRALMGGNDNAELVRELRELRREVADLRRQSGAFGSEQTRYARKTYELQERQELRSEDV